MSINIPSHKDDPNYRYKMPAIRSKVEGSGNGIKTNFMNLRDVASSLKRSPMYVVKFLACELSTHGRYFADEGKAIFQGVHADVALASKLDLFIDNYVLCPKCTLPEIDLLVADKFISGKCNACGETSRVNNIHRVAVYIVKNPPEGSTVGGKKTREDKKKIKDEAKAVDIGETGKKVLKKKIIKKKVVKKKKKDNDSDSFDMKSAAANVIMVRLAELLSNSETTPSAFFQEIRTIQLTQALDTAERFYLALAAWFKCGLEVSDTDDFTGDFKKVSVEDYKNATPFLSAIAYDSPKESISALQQFMTDFATPESFKSHYPLIMKSFYDESIVDDDDVLEFYASDSGSDAYLAAKNVLQPLIQWMNTNNDSSGSYDESSDSETRSVPVKAIGG
eukprot:GHVH01005996.1.p1 GENE.GHVH01005996.1~~GHVH01005996.1.p1  ORF type:complete len:392 (-),score=81.71 GHVH01005996.1:94-1269(-)